MSAKVQFLLLISLLLAAPPVAAIDHHEVLYAPEGNRLRRYDVETIGPSLVEDILIDEARAAVQGGDLPAGKFRDINGMVCAFPDGSGRFVAGEDTGQPSPRAGWGIFTAEGRQIGKLAATYNVAGAEPFGCAFAPDGTLFTTSVGTQGFGAPDGQLIQWFPPFDGFPGEPGAYPLTNAASTNFCKIAIDIGTANGIAIDAKGRVYVSGSSQLSVFRFSPPFPTAPNATGGCGAIDAQGSPQAEDVTRETFLGPHGLSTFSGLAFNHRGNLYAAEVLNGRIGEYDPEGNLVRLIVAPPEALPPISTGNPQGIAVGADGTLYYADLDLVGTLPDVGPGPNGKVWRVRFDEQGEPLPPEMIRENLRFPDGISIFPGNLQPKGWPTYAGSPTRTFWNGRETSLTAANIADLSPKWSFLTNAIITASPSMALVTVAGEGRIPVAFLQSWDARVYAIRIRDGSELWRFSTADRPGVSFPNTASVHVGEIDGGARVFVGSGQTFYALDATDGSEIWRFDAGTGCRNPGDCGFDAERNEIESSALLVDEKIVFGMDVNDVAKGKGGFYALDARDGRLRWFFDLESGSTCRPEPGDEIRRYDGYHSEEELGLPAGFLTTRSGCDHPRSSNGCGNVWSSAAYDGKRGFLYFASSNCDTDDDPSTGRPPPPMPAFDEALIALDLEGHPVWRWRPREIDNADLAFGAVPNLFTALIEGVEREVVGLGNKDGTYYLLDRDGVNELSGTAWDDADPSSLPYWTTKVVPGGPAGGIPATAAVDDANDRIYFGTAPGSFGAVFNPQRPTVHALDAGTGAVLWQNTGEINADATFSPTSGIPGVVFTGAVVGGFLRGYDASDGTRLLARPVGFAVASAPAFWRGIGIVGAGIGARSDDPNDASEITSRIPQPLSALCVPGTAACAIDQPISGRRLRLTDPAGRPHLRRVRLTSLDPSISAPLAAGPGDPTLVGATLRVFHPVRSEEISLTLPAGGWKARGSPPGAKGYVYADRKGDHGPCRRAEVRNGKVEVYCRGAGLTFSLDERAQEALAAELRLGTDRALCARFGGRVRRDHGTSTKALGAFSARDAPAPISCPGDIP